MPGVQLARLLMAALALAGAGLVGKFALPQPSDAAQTQQAIIRLQRQVATLEAERELPARALERVRRSVCFLYVEYSYRDAANRRHMVHISGSGFVIAKGWLATNRHVAEPWRERSGEADVRVIRQLAFFPDQSKPVQFGAAQAAADDDLALIHFDPASAPAAAPLALAKNEPQVGDAVLVIGYPLGVDGMLVKAANSPERFSSNDLLAAREMAAASLIRPWATQGHVGDALNRMLVYDAATTHGASGGPVLNSAGEVVAVNSAYVSGFSGGSVGIPASALEPLLRRINTPIIAARIETSTRIRADFKDSKKKEETADR